MNQWTIALHGGDVTKCFGASSSTVGITRRGLGGSGVDLGPSYSLRLWSSHESRRRFLRLRHGRPVRRAMSQRAMPSVRAELGAAILSARQAKGLSQVKLGELAGLSAKFIGEVERGQKSISVD